MSMTVLHARPQALEPNRVCERFHRELCAFRVLMALVGLAYCGVLLYGAWRVLVS